MKLLKLAFPALLLTVLMSTSCGNHQCDAFTAQEYEQPTENNEKQSLVLPEDV